MDTFSHTIHQLQGTHKTIIKYNPIPDISGVKSRCVSINREETMIWINFNLNILISFYDFVLSNILYFMAEYDPTNNYQIYFSLVTIDKVNLWQL